MPRKPLLSVRGPHDRLARAGALLAAVAACIACGNIAAAEPRLELAQAAQTAAAAAPERGQSAAEREAAYVARLDQIVAPLQDYSLSADDNTKLNAAFKALASGDVEKARTTQASVSDPLARTLIEWERLRRGKGQAADYLKFLSENPDWPSREQLQRRMEETLFEEGGDTDTIATYFTGREARSPAGMAVLASVHIAHGEKEQAKALAVKIWREKDLPAGLEKGFLSRFGSMLSEQDHKWRLDRLLGEDVKLKAAREDRAAQAKRVIPLLSAAEQKTAQARLSVFMRSGKPALAGAQKGTATDWGVVFHKVQQYRRAEKVEEAAKLLKTASLDPSVVANLDEWWLERRGLAYLALKANKPKLAYEIVRDAGPVSVNELNDQTFMAGWIALRYLKDVKQAEKHFADLVRTADGPLSRGRAHYWMGRTAEELGDTARSRASYQTAARETDTFHGLLALQKLSPGHQPLAIEPPALPSADIAAKFTNHGAAKAIALARKAGLRPHRDARVPAQPGQDRKGRGVGGNGRTLCARHRRHADRRAHRQGVDRQRPEHDLLQLSGARAAEVHAAASATGDGDAAGPGPPGDGVPQRYRVDRRRAGILQVMKVTANHICRDYKIKCTHARLLTDDSYNIMIASAYVADRMAEWQGSYVLALSSYNAGPGRTRQWINEFGDPRTAAIDPIDWIERIPIEETRRYVAKVLSNIQIYRARLGEAATALRLDEDLNRARTASSDRAGRARDEHGGLATLVGRHTFEPVGGRRPCVGREVR